MKLKCVGFQLLPMECSLSAAGVARARQGSTPRNLIQASRPNLSSTHSRTMSTNRTAASAQRSSASTSNGGGNVSGPWKPGQPIRFDDAQTSKPIRDFAAKRQAKFEAAKQSGFQASKQAHRRYIAQQRESEREKLERGLPTYSYKTPPTRLISSPDRKPDGAKGKDRALEGCQPPARAPSLCYTYDVDEANDLLGCLGPGPLGFE